MADTQSGPEEIGFLLVSRFSMMAFTAAVEPLRSANRMSGRELYRWRIFSCDGEAVTASSGISFVPDAGIARCPTVFVCAGIDPHLFEINRDRLTCCGGTASLDLMLHLNAERHGHDLSTAVAEQFIHAGGHDPGDPQRMTLRRRLRVSHPKLIAVIQQMESNLEEPLSREELASSVGLSTRQVEPCSASTCAAPRPAITWTCA